MLVVAEVSLSSPNKLKKRVAMMPVCRWAACDGTMAVEYFKALPKTTVPLVHQNSGVVPGCACCNCLPWFVPEEKEGGLEGFKGHGSGWRCDPIPKLIKNLDPALFCGSRQEVVNMPVKNLRHFHHQGNFSLRMCRCHSQGGTGGCGIVQGAVKWAGLDVLQDQVIPLVTV
eukprot:5918715-Ditylum_brightwellii.AAC.1